MKRKAIVIRPKDFENLVNIEEKIQTMMGDFALPDNFEQLLQNNNEEVNRKLSEVLTRLGNLQKQVDNEVTAWFLEGAPCDKFGSIIATKEPVCDWSENGEDGKDSYAAHEGDTYTDITSYVTDTETPTAGHSWRFCYCERETARGTVTDWHWHKIADSDAIKALQEAAKAVSTADGKATIFMSREGNELPRNYQIGDMWIINSTALEYGNLPESITSGDLLTANVASVEYDASHWGKHIKYTDDTVAEQAFSEAQIAVSKATEAHEDALIALQGLSEVRSDGKVYHDEMKQLEIQKLNIIEERNELVGSDGLGGEAERWEVMVNYTNEYYIAANKAIEALAYYSDVNNIDEDEEFVYNFITIDKEGAKPWSDITNYYTERQKLLSQIADATKKYADTINTVAEQAIEAASNAQNVANEAYTNAEISKTQLDEIDNDKVIARTEFAILETQLENIQKDYNEIQNSVNVYNDTSVYVELSNEFEEYKTAHYNAVNALKYHCGMEVGETPQKATRNASGSISIKSTKINPNDIIFNEVNVDYDNISAYYGKRQSILNLIAQKTRKYADSLQMELSPENIQEILSNIQITIGGVNIIKNSRNRIFNAFGDSTTVSHLIVDTQYTNSKLDTESAISLGTLLHLDVEGDNDDIKDITDMQWGSKYITASVDIRISARQNMIATSHNGKFYLGIVFRNGDKDLYTKWQDVSEGKSISNNRWYRLTFTWKMDKDVTDTYTASDGHDYLVDSVYFIVASPDVYKAGTVFDFRNTQFEFATNPSEWSPAPEDVESGLEEMYSIALEAQENAESAREDAERSMTILEEMSNDNFITAQEKIAIKKEWDEIKYDHEQADATSEQLWDNIGKERPQAWDNYDSIFNQLKLYLKPFSLSSINDESEDIDAEFIVSVDLSEQTLILDGEEYVGREAFNRIFAMYYHAHNQFMNAVAEDLAYLEVANLETKVYQDMGQAIADAAIAKENATQAKAEAEEAAGRLTQWASDSVISPFEKPAIEEELIRVEEDKAQILSSCTMYNIDFTTTSYGRAYGPYHSVLENIVNSIEETISVPDDMKTKQRTYYNSRSTILNKISEKADKKAEEYANAAYDMASGEIKAVQDAAEAAQARAEQAAQDAKDASERLSEWGSDGVISPLERPGIREELTRVSADYEKMCQDAILYGVEIEEFGDIHAKYVEILESIICSEEELVPVPTDFRYFQHAYYMYRTTILGHISAAADEQAAQYAENARAEAMQAVADAKSYTDSLTNALGQSLQNQIDGVVDSYFMEGTPTTTNSPAKDWNTDALKQRHEGDTYTSISEYPDESAGKSWRWCRGNTSGDNVGWHWHPIADSDAVKALQAAAKAQDTADKKRRVFTTTPTPPYEMGDLWVNNSGSYPDTLYCKFSRSTGGYNASDWTSSTAAQAAMNAAQGASTAAAEAKQAAELAKSETEAAAYLKSVLNEGSTDIQGGLVLTNVLALKDINDNITAGISGLGNYSKNGVTYKDNVLLWGGGTYNQAYTAAQNNYKINTNGEQITTLIKKDGTGKIGVFEIDKTKAVVNDQDGNERVAIVYNTLDFENIPVIKAYKSLSYVDTKSYDNDELPFEYLFNTEKNEDVNFDNENLSEMSYISGKIALMNIRVIGPKKDGNSEFVIDPDKLNKLEVYLKLPGGIKIQLSTIQMVAYDEIQGQTLYEPFNEPNNGLYDIPFTIDVSQYQISKTLWNTFKISIESDITDGKITGEFTDEIKFYLIGSRKSCLAPNGIAIVSDSGERFSVDSKMGKQTVIISGLDKTRPEEKNHLYEIKTGIANESNLLTNITTMSSYLGHVSYNLNEFLLQINDLLSNTLQLMKDLDVFCNKIKGSTASSEYSALKTSIEKVKSCLAESDGTSQYTGVDDVKRYGILTPRTAKTPSSMVLPLSDLKGLGKQSRVEKKYLSTLESYANTLNARAQNTTLLGLS